MRTSFLITLGAAVLTASMTLPVVIDDGYAKSFSSSRSFSRSSFRSSSSSSKSSKSLFSSFSTKKGLTKTKTSHKISSKDSKGSNSIKSGSKSHSLTGGNASKNTKQVLAAKKQRQQFKKPPVTPSNVKMTNGRPVNRVAATKQYQDRYKDNGVYGRARTSNRNTYWDRRDNYYSRYPVNSVVYQSSPSFGMWDTLFLYSILNNNNSSQFAHNHQNDADYRMWREDADRLALQNAELRGQLAAMDAGAMKLAGTPVDANYLPNGVDPDLALSSEALVSQLPIMRVGVGGTAGAYFLATAGVMAPNLKMVNMIPVTTQGTPEILQCIADGKCDAGWVQGDGYWNFIEEKQTDNLPFERVFSPYQEAVHVICHEKGPNSIDDLDDDNRLWFPKGSGAAVTMKNWIEEDSDYAEINTVLNDPGMVVASNAEALLKVKGNDCMMYVAAQGATKFMADVEKIAKARKLVLIDVNDGSLNNTEDPSGENVYEFGEIDSSVYPNLTRNAGALWGSGDIHTTFMNADFLVSTNWKKTNSKIYPELALQTIALQDNIKSVLKPQ